jgi:hypothetical protein
MSIKWTRNGTCYLAPGQPVPTYVMTGGAPDAPGYVILRESAKSFRAFRVTSSGRLHPAGRGGAHKLLRDAEAQAVTEMVEIAHAVAIAQEEIREQAEWQATPAYRRFVEATRGRGYRGALDVLHEQALAEQAMIDMVDAAGRMPEQMRAWFVRHGLNTRDALTADDVLAARTADHEQALMTHLTAAERERAYDAQIITSDCCATPKRRDQLDHSRTVAAGSSESVYRCLPGQCARPEVNAATEAVHRWNRGELQDGAWRQRIVTKAHESRMGWRVAERSLIVDDHEQALAEQQQREHDERARVNDLRRAVVAFVARRRRIEERAPHLTFTEAHAIAVDQDHQRARYVDGVRSGTLCAGCGHAGHSAGPCIEPDAGAPCGCGAAMLPATASEANEQAAAHDRFVEQLTAFVPESWESSEGSAESIVVEYVRAISERVCGLGGSLERVPDDAPAPKLLALDVSAVAIRALADAIRSSASAILAQLPADSAPTITGECGSTLGDPHSGPVEPYVVIDADELCHVTTVSAGDHVMLCTIHARTELSVAAVRARRTGEL